MDKNKIISEKPEPRFVVGAIVTYKSREDFPGKKYTFGGNNYGGATGKITHYGNFKPDYDCYAIAVTTPEDERYIMLEKEFEEFYAPKKDPVARTLKISLSKAKKLYKEGPKEIKELLLETFSKEELEEPKFFVFEESFKVSSDLSGILGIAVGVARAGDARKALLVDPNYKVKVVKNYEGRDALFFEKK